MAAVAVVAVVAVAAAVTVATAGAGTAVACVAVGAAKGAAVGMVSGAVSGAATGAVTHVVSTGSFDGIGEAVLTGMGDGALSGAVSGAISGGVTAKLTYGNFSSKSSLEQHFIKHGDDFDGMYYNVKEYAKGAKYVVKNGTYIPERNAYIRFLGINGRANYAFVGMDSHGRAVTYHVKSVSAMIKNNIAMFS